MAESKAAVALALFAAVAIVPAQNHRIDWFCFSSGGGPGASLEHGINVTLGQAIQGWGYGEQTRATWGYWYNTPGPSPAPPPHAGWAEVESMPSRNSGRSVSDGAWLATDGLEVIYAAKGNKSDDFFGYRPAQNRWAELAPWPKGREGKPPRKGSRGAADGSGRIYATKGNNTTGFWRYETGADSWTQLTDVPLGITRKRVKGGTDLVHVVRDDIDYLYLLKGGRNEFYRFNTTTGLWDTLAPVPSARSKWNKGSFLACDGANAIYAHQATYYDRTIEHHYMYRYDIAADTWYTRPLRGMPLLGYHAGRLRLKKSKDGAAGAWSEGWLYALKGGNSQQFFRSAPPFETWYEMDTMPSFGTTNRRKMVKTGGDLVTWDNRTFYALKGNKTREFWRYTKWQEEDGRGGRPPRSGAQAAGALPNRATLAVGANPATGPTVAIRWNSATSGPKRLVVSDIAGRTLQTWVLPASRTGTTALDLRTLAPGVYLLRLETGAETATARLIIAR